MPGATKPYSVASPLLWALVALALIVFSQHVADADLFAAWQTEEYSHGVLIPLIALFLAWHRLTEARPVLRPSWWGLVFLAAAGALFLLAQLAAFYMAAQLGLVVAVTGLCLAFLGRAASRAMAPALLYLLFAIPLPHLVQANLSEDMQLWSSSLGVWLLDLVDIPVFQQGNIIDLGGFRLQVVDACSGLRYLFPLMSFGYLVAFLLKDKWWKRIVIFLSTIPITIILNSLRIAFIGLTVDLWGENMARGFIHGFEGWSVFLVCIVLLMIETWLLLRIGKGGRFRYEYLAPARGKLFGGIAGPAAPGIAALAAAAFFALVFGIGLGPRDEIIPAHAPLASFPLILGDWHGRQASLDADVLDALHLSDFWFADYRQTPDAEPVNLYISYYATQSLGAMTHSPANCIPGGGWEIETDRIKTLHLPGGEDLRLSRLLIRRGDAAQLVYYWFDERGRDLAETYGAKWYLLWDSIFMHRTDGALIRLVTPLDTDETEAAAEKRLDGFLAVVYPKLDSFIPGSAHN